MNRVTGHYFDGRRSARTEVVLTFAGDRLLLSGNGIDKSLPLRDIAVSSGIGAIPRTLRFPDGSLCEIAGDVPLDRLLASQGLRKLPGILHRWEKNLPLAFLTLFLTIVLIAALVKYGIPAAARKVAFSLPSATETALGKESLAILDRLVFTPTKLSAERQREVTRLFRETVSGLPAGQAVRIEFRSSEKIVANAFALPSGIIVVTDGLVNLAQHDEEITGVLAHEAGHLVYRHALRHVLQNSGTALVIALVTGDITSVSSLSAGLPTALVEAKYSRDFEIEADDAAVAHLRKRGIPVHYYTDMLRRLEEAHDKKSGKDEKRVKAEKGDESSVTDFFASHPMMRERIERITKAQ